MDLPLQIDHLPVLLRVVTTEESIQVTLLQFWSGKASANVKDIVCNKLSEMPVQSQGKCLKLALQGAESYGGKCLKATLRVKYINGGPYELIVLHFPLGVASYMGPEWKLSFCLHGMLTAKPKHVVILSSYETRTPQLTTILNMPHAVTLIHPQVERDIVNPNLNLHLRRKHAGYLDEENKRNHASESEDAIDEGSDQDGNVWKASIMTVDLNAKTNARAPIETKGHGKGDFQEDSEETEEDHEDTKDDGWGSKTGTENDGDEETEDDMD
eukprot:Gb_22370 [translate_table: standard]